MMSAFSWQNSMSLCHASFCTPRPNLPVTPGMSTVEDSIHGHHQMVNTKIRLIIFFAAKNREALYSQQKQDWEVTVAQILNSLLPNSYLN